MTSAVPQNWYTIILISVLLPFDQNSLTVSVFFGPKWPRLRHFPKPPEKERSQVEDDLLERARRRTCRQSRNPTTRTSSWTTGSEWSRGSSGDRHGHVSRIDRAFTAMAGNDHRRRDGLAIEAPTSVVYGEDHSRPADMTATPAPAGPCRYRRSPSQKAGRPFPSSTGPVLGSVAAAATSGRKTLKPSTSSDQRVTKRRSK